MTMAYRYNNAAVVVEADAVYDAAGLASMESSLLPSSLLGLLGPPAPNPASRHSPPQTAINSNKPREFPEGLVSSGGQQATGGYPPPAARGASQRPQAVALSVRQMAKQQHTSGGGEVSEPASGGSSVGTGQIGRSRVGCAAAVGVEEKEGQQSATLQRLAQQRHVPSKGPLLSSSSSFSCLSDAGSSSSRSGSAGSSRSTSVAPDVLGSQIVDACHGVVRGMLGAVLMEAMTLQPQDALHLLDRMNSHRGWTKFRRLATALIAAAMRLNTGVVPPPPPPPRRSGASTPSTPAEGFSRYAAAAAAAAAVVGGVPLAPPPPPPPPRPRPHHPSRMYDTAATISPFPRPPPPPPPRSRTSTPAGSSTTPPVHFTPGVSAPARPFGGLDDLGATPPSDSSGPGGSGVAEPSSSLLLLLNVLRQQNDPRILINTLAQDPQLLTSLLMSASGGAGGVGGAMSGSETFGLPGPQLPQQSAGGTSSSSSGLHTPPSLPAHSDGNGDAPLMFDGLLSAQQAHRDGGGGPFDRHVSHPHSAGGLGLQQDLTDLTAAAGAAAAAAAGHGGGGEVAFEDLGPAVLQKICSVLATCGPYIRIEHVDSNVRRHLLQLQLQFGEQGAVSALHAVEVSVGREVRHAGEEEVGEEEVGGRALMLP
ncbi:hypothetical protein PLESTB_001540600 [Pleodorina starrii]|uniref:Uncharacterized protein n=1 Tax=Pleodorina starrii TaxID=330485 RepID=A0A9W6F841_9CHLO|nr:hypothetical protein PLESTB_001540600 [Pleodorina starrii]